MWKFSIDFTVETILIYWKQFAKNYIPIFTSIKLAALA